MSHISQSLSTQPQQKQYDEDVEKKMLNLIMMLKLLLWPK